MLWRREVPAHHYVEVLPDGRLLTLLTQSRHIPSVDPEVEVWDDVLALLSDDGEIVESFSLYDVITSSTLRFPLKVVGRGENRGERWIDLFHCNAIRQLGHPRVAGDHPLNSPHGVLVTSRHQDAVMVIDWRARELLWFWGPGELSGPHDAAVVDNGHLLVFDNGLERRWSRVIEVDPLTQRIVQEFTPAEREGFFNRVLGASQRLPNGNTLITNSAGAQIMELDPTGRPVWVFVGTRRSNKGGRVQIARATRIGTLERRF
jgi:hypothetical protein